MKGGYAKIDNARFERPDRGDTAGRRARATPAMAHAALTRTTVLPVELSFGK